MAEGALSVVVLSLIIHYLSYPCQGLQTEMARLAYPRTRPLISIPSQGLLLL
jgi:hypothetical protein